MKNIRRLPEGWKWVKTTDVLDNSIKFPIRMGPFGSQLTIDELVDEGIFVIGIEHVLNKRFDDIGCKFITEDKFSGLKGFEVKPGDVLMTMMGTIGRTAVVPEGIRKSIISSHLLKMTLKKGIYPDYIKWILSYLSPVYKQIESESQGSIMKGLNTQIVKNLFFPLPQKTSEQVAITRAVENKMEKVEKIRQAALIQKEAIAAVQSVILRKAFPFKEGDRLPKGWKWERLKKISTKIQYGFSKESFSRNVGPKLLRITDIQNGKVNWDTVPFCECNEKEKEQYMLEDGDIVFVRTGATTGKSFLIKNPPFSLFASYLIRVQCNRGQVKPEFLIRFFQSPTYWNYISQGARGGTLAGFNASMLSDISIPLPSTLEDQVAIVNDLEKKLTRAERMKSAKDRQWEAVEALPGAILREVFGFEK